MTKDEKKEYDAITNYVETSQPDTVAEYIRKLLKENERIAELEEQIKDLKDDVKFLKKKLFEKIDVSILGATESKYAEIRHEICEKIRRKMTVYRYVEVKTKNGYEWALTDSNINEILNQIERGEE